MPVADSDKSGLAADGTIEICRALSGGTLTSLENKEMGTERPLVSVDDIGGNKKAAVGFEPTNNGFANRRLRPLGYAAMMSPSTSDSIASAIVYPSKMCNASEFVGGEGKNLLFWRRDSGVKCAHEKTVLRVSARTVRYRTEVCWSNDQRTVIPAWVLRRSCHPFRVESHHRSLYGELECSLGL